MRNPVLFTVIHNPVSLQKKRTRTFDRTDQTTKWLLTLTDWLVGKKGNYSTSDFLCPIQLLVYYSVYIVSNFQGFFFADHSQTTGLCTDSNLISHDFRAVIIAMLSVPLQKKTQAFFKQNASLVPSPL